MQVWSALQKISFRFVFILFVLVICFIYNLWFSSITQWVLGVLGSFITWFGTSVLHLPYDIERQGRRGDTAYDYTLLALIVLAALAGTMVWTILDRKRTEYVKLYYWLTVLVRFFVGIVLFYYAIVKVIKLQFPFPGLSAMAQPFGDTYPVSLAWNFLGYSEGYNLFLGMAELCGLLLLFRKTATFGALICTAVMANVVAINYFYDISVKMFSMVLFVMCLFLLLPNISRFYRLLIRGEAVKLYQFEAPVLKYKWLLITKYVIKYTLIALAIIPSLSDTIEARKVRGNLRPKPALYGVYEVSKFISTDQQGDTAKRDEWVWKQLVVDYEDQTFILFTNDKREKIALKTDTGNRKLSLAFSDEPDTFYHFHYSIPDPERLVLKGKILDNEVSVELIKKVFALQENSFHWISDTPNVK